MNKLITIQPVCDNVYVCLHACYVVIYMLNICVCVCTSKPCRRTLRVDRGPRPQATYNCGVSSLAKSAICYKRDEKYEPARKVKHCQKTLY